MNVLKPKYIPAGIFTEVDREGDVRRVQYFSIQWMVIGQAKDMEEAKRFYGGAPVLESA